MVSMLSGPMGKETNNPMIKPRAIVSSITRNTGERIEDSFGTKIHSFSKGTK
jgi:hypothetical protein